MIKYGEIGIKGKNRYLFEDALMDQIRFALRNIDAQFEVSKQQGRIYLEMLSDYDYDEVTACLQRVFGITAICPVLITEDNQWDSLCRVTGDYMQKVYPEGNVSFKVFARRLDKHYPKTSMEIAADMGEYLLDRFPDLYAPYLVLADLADHVSGINLDAVQKFHGIIPTVDGLYYKADFVLVQLAGIVIHVEADTDRLGNLPDASGSLEVKLDGGRWRGLGQVDALQIHIALGRRGAAFGDALHGDLLHQPLVIGFHGVQAIDHIVDTVGTMGGGIAQRNHGVKLLQVFLGLLPLHGLRLVDDQNRIGFCDDINGPTAAELVQLHVDAPGILALGVEGLAVDNHHIDGAVRRKAVDLCQLRGIIDKEADLLPVLLCKMLLGHLEGFINAFANGNAGHHNDELRPAVLLVELIHGFDVGIGFAYAGFHFDGQVVAALQLGRRRNLIAALDFLYMLQNQSIGKLRHDPGVGPAGKGRIVIQPAHEGGAVFENTQALIHHIGRLAVGLAREHIHHCLRSIRLESLMLELQLHVFSPPVSICCFFIFFCNTRMFAFLHSSRF